MAEDDNQAQTSTSLEQKEAEARIAKLNIEKQLLSLQLSPKYERRELLKILAGLGGLFAALAAVATFFFSAWRWQQESFDTRQLHIEERFDRALEKLTGDSSTSKLGGVVSLKSFLTKDNKERHPRVLLSLTHALAIERDPIIRDAIIEVLNGTNTDVVDKNILNEALGSLVDLNRAIVREEELNRDRVFGFRNSPKGESPEARARSIASAIVTLLRKGARLNDLSGIYCVGCDLSGLDLQATKFDGAIFESAKFEGAKLVDTSFDNTDLYGANFTSADLRRAKITFSSSDDFDPNIGSEDLIVTYSNNHLVKKAFTPLPDFKCADLRDADFTGRVIGVSINVADVHTENSSRFNNANLEKANFSKILFDVINTKKDFSGSLTGMELGSERIEDGKYVYWIHHIFINEDSRLSEMYDSADASSELKLLQKAFEGSNWQQSLVSAYIKDWLITNPPSYWKTKCASEKG